MPIIIISGTPAIGDPLAAQPGVAVLRKPIDVTALDATIKRMLAQRLAV
jgi:hypothetical protein